MSYNKKIKLLDSLREQNKPNETNLKGQITLESEDEIIKYVSCFDMKLSVVLLKIQLNSLLVKYNYKSEISPEALRTMCMCIEKKYEENRSLINLNKINDIFLEKINIIIFFQNESYKNFLDENYFKNFSRSNLKTLISELTNSDILKVVLEEDANSRLEEINNSNDVVELREKASRIIVSNMLNIHYIKDLENDLKHCKYIMQYQASKLAELNAENRIFEMNLLKEKETNAKLTSLLENSIKKEPTT